MRNHLTLALFLGFVACGSDTNLVPNGGLNGDANNPDNPTVGDLNEPISDAGDDQEVSPLVQVSLNGVNSYDPNGLTIASYQWVIASMPTESITILENADTVNPSFFADFAGEYVLQLQVTNSQGIVDSTADEVVILAKPLQGFYVQMSWDAASDLDLHVQTQNAALWDEPNDCSFCNMNPDWGQTGNALDDASLDADAIDGFGPETITIASPAAGTYQIQAHYYGVGGARGCDFNCPVSNAKVDVYIDGNLAKSFTATLSTSDQVWDVATLDWPSGVITTNNSFSTTSGSCGLGGW